MVDELGLCEPSQMHHVEVNVINGKSETFDGMTVNFKLQNVSRDLNLHMGAQTTRNVTGKLQSIDWNKCAKQWPHLKDIKLPKSKTSKVDLLIGLDNVKLHKSLGEIQCEKGAPVARLTPFGWTCVGAIAVENIKEKTRMFSFYAKTMLTDIDQTLQEFWEITGTPDKNVKRFSKNNIETLEDRKIHYT